jgi:hypothetical protein
MMNNLETVGNAQISTSVSKFGGGSMAFDGTGDYLVAPSSPNFTLGPSGANFTIEFWIYVNSVSGGNVFMGTWQDNATNFSNRWCIFYHGSAGITFTNSGGSNGCSGGTLNTGQWYHIAIVRNGSTITFYKDGTSTGTQTTDQAYTTQDKLLVGAQTGGSLTAMNGYIDDLRITKGYARYTSNFTPPTAAFPTF